MLVFVGDDFLFFLILFLFLFFCCRCWVADFSLSSALVVVFFALKTICYDGIEKQQKEACDT